MHYTQERGECCVHYTQERGECCVHYTQERGECCVHYTQERGECCVHYTQERGETIISSLYTSSVADQLTSILSVVCFFCTSISNLRNVAVHHYSTCTHTHTHRETLVCAMIQSQCTGHYTMYNLVRWNDHLLYMYIRHSDHDNRQQYLRAEDVCTHSVQIVIAAVLHTYFFIFAVWL